MISVDGDGTVRRCHFVESRSATCTTRTSRRCLAERPCTNDTCGCHIGYVHLDRLRLYDAFGGGVLERVPGRVPVTVTFQPGA